LSQANGQRLADTAPGAGNQGNHPVQIEAGIWHFNVPFLWVTPPLYRSFVPPPVAAMFSREAGMTDTPAGPSPKDDG